MLVKFYLYDTIIKEVMLTTIPHTDDIIVIDGFQYSVQNVIYNFDEQYFIRIELE